MANIRLTEHQQQAVSLRERDIIVSAGAGSGKTTVLVERFIQMVLQGEADVTQILSITYTRKAAGEMRARIRRRLNEEGQSEQLRRLDSAYISTIDAFCVRLLQENPFDACYDPDTSQLSEVEEQRIFATAFTQSMDELVIDHIEPARSVLKLAYGRVDYDSNLRDPLQAIRKALFQILNNLRIYGFDLPQLQQWREQMQSQPELWKQQLSQAAITSLMGILPSAIPLVGSNPVKPFWQQIVDRCSDGSGVEIEELCKLLAYQTRGSLQHPVAVQAQDRCRAWQRILSGVGSETNQQAMALNPGILQIIESCWHNFQEIKQKRSAQDFTDGLQRCIDLLGQHPGVQQRYQKHFKCVMVDEFQDANPLQMRLLELVAAPGRLFTVGDVQQSIYGFRHAEPSLLSGLTQNGGRDGEGAVVQLTANYRSREGVLLFVQKAFEPMWQSGFMALSAGQQFEPSRSACTALLMVDPQPSQAQYARAAARAIGHDILHQRKEHGRKYGDFAILLRQTSNVADLEHGLTELGIPFYNTARRHYYHRAEVRDMLNAAVVVATPWEDIALASVLRSPLVGLDSDTLELIARDGGANPAKNPFWIRLTNWLNRSEPHPQKALAEPFVSTVRQLQKRGERLTAAQCLEELAHATQLQLKLICRPDGKQRWLNVRKLIEITLEHTGTLLEFCDHADDLVQLAMREGEAPLLEEQADVVRIFTVHGAKGLEFPVVYLADITRKVTRNPGTIPLRCVPSLHLLAHDLVGESCLTQACVQWERQRSWEEELRLWYVACTRPIHQLVMLGFPDCKGTWLEVLLKAAGIPVPNSCQPGLEHGMEYRHYPEPEAGATRLPQADRELERITAWLRGELEVDDQQLRQWME